MIVSSLAVPESSRNDADIHWQGREQEGEGHTEKHDGESQVGIPNPFVFLRAHQRRRAVTVAAAVVVVARCLR